MTSRRPGRLGHLNKKLVQMFAFGISSFKLNFESLEGRNRISEIQTSHVFDLFRTFFFVVKLAIKTEICFSNFLAV